MTRTGRLEALRYGPLGALSGAASGTLVQLLPDTLQVNPWPWLLLSPGSLVPGLVFGVLLGAALVRRGLAGWPRYAAYVAASAVSYLAAFTLAAEVLLDLFPDSHVAIGLLAGLFGSACLTGLSLLMFGFLRRWRPCLALLVIGCLLGGLLPLVTGEAGFLATLLFFALWQGGYAAGLAAALPVRRGAA